MKNYPKITPEEIYRLAKLSRLEISDTDVKKYSDQMNKILKYVSQINEVNLDEVDPLTHVFDTSIQGRQDKVGNCLNPKEVFLNVPEKEDSLIKVPPVLKKKSKSN